MNKICLGSLKIQRWPKLIKNLMVTKRCNASSNLGRPLQTQIEAFLDVTRFKRPIGSVLLFIPCAWSTALGTACGCLPDILLLSKFAVGAILTRSAGCIINDSFDGRYDAQVARTKNRPMARKIIGIKTAAASSIILLLAAFGLLLTFDKLTIITGIVSVPLMIIYPLLKRYTYYPQVFLGMTINIGCLVGYSNASGTFDPFTILPLYFGSIFWTMFYDTIYGFQDVLDDKKLGLKSMSIKLIKKRHPKIILGAFAMVSILSWGLSGYFSQQTYPFYISLLLAGVHFSYQLYSLEINKPSSCMRSFKSNQYIGLIIFVGLVLSQLTKKKIVTAQSKSFPDFIM